MGPDRDVARVNGRAATRAGGLGGRTRNRVADEHTGAMKYSPPVSIADRDDLGRVGALRLGFAAEGSIWARITRSEDSCPTGVRVSRGHHQLRMAGTLPVREDGSSMGAALPVDAWPSARTRSLTSCVGVGRSSVIDARHLVQLEAAARGPGNLALSSLSVPYSYLAGHQHPARGWRRARKNVAVEARHGHAHEDGRDGYALRRAVARSAGVRAPKEKRAAHSSRPG
jgi:hypothetical protein